MDEQDQQRQPWDPPSAGTPWAGATPVSGPSDADGPPPPPWVRRRRRRRRIAGAVAVIVLLVAVPLGLLWAGAFDRPDEAASTEEGPDTGSPRTPDASPDPSAELDAPDPDRFAGSDADLATVMRGVEVSEQVMLRFQADLAEAYALGGTEDLDPFYAAVRTAAATGSEALESARDDLDAASPTDAADAIRRVYLDHLDAWLALMEATEADPTLFGPVGDTARFDVEINATALDFARTLESALPADADDEIVRFAERLLDRGFRFDSEAQA